MNTSQLELNQCTKLVSLRSKRNVPSLHASLAASLQRGQAVELLGILPSVELRGELDVQPGDSTTLLFALDAALSRATSAGFRNPKSREPWLSLLPRTLATAASGGQVLPRATRSEARGLRPSAQLVEHLRVPASPGGEPRAPGHPAGHFVSSDGAPTTEGERPVSGHTGEFARRQEIRVR